MFRTLLAIKSICTINDRRWDPSKSSDFPLFSTQKIERLPGRAHHEHASPARQRRRRGCGPIAHFQCLQGRWVALRIARTKRTNPPPHKDLWGAFINFEIESQQSPRARWLGLHILTMLGSGTRHLGYGIWDMGYGIWDMGYGTWDLGSGTSSRGHAIRQAA